MKSSFLCNAPVMDTGIEPVPLPEQITAGARLGLDLLTAYPAPIWVLTVLLYGPSSLDPVALPHGSGHRLRLARRYRQLHV